MNVKPLIRDAAVTAARRLCEPEPERAREQKDEARPAMPPIRRG